VLSVSSSRADVTILTSVWQSLAARSDCALHVLLTGMHMAADAPPVDGLPAGAVIHRGGADLGGEGNARAAEAMAEITRFSGETCTKIQPDVVLLVGDRLDMLPAAVGTLPMNIPLAHLHGGEITEGAVDDRLRHALTKLSHLHLASGNGAAARLRALGEEDWRIHVTGAPALDTLLSIPKLPLAAFQVETGIDTLGSSAAELRLVTVHPETNAADPLAPGASVLAALDQRPGPTLFTAPNSDPGGAELRRQIREFVARRRWARMVDTLGPRLYSSALRHAAVMIGNSSSGIIEAGLFGLPVINVGARQAGREHGVNVVDVPADTRAVVAAIDALPQPPAKYPPFSPYGDGRAGPRIAAVLLALPPRHRLLIKTGLTALPTAADRFRPSAADGERTNATRGLADVRTTAR
jgi:UDP-hydrolysing UDP-N-acetyl-D-glucosamine 2-epimerase